MHIIQFSPVIVAAFVGLSLAACSSGTSSRAAEAPNSSAASPVASMDQSSMGQSTMGGMDHSSGSSMSMGDHMGMDLGPADAEYDLRFVDAMIPHHEGAVVMARDALQKSRRPEIKKLAQDIIAAQDREIRQMKQWRKTWYPNVSDTPMAYDPAMGHTMPMTPEQRQNMMMSSNLGAANAQYDLRFINQMLPHHEGALVMARDALQKSKRPEIKALAEAILSSQQQEIDQMKQWRKQWYSQ